MEDQSECDSVFNPFASPSSYSHELSSSFHTAPLSNTVHSYSRSSCIISKSSTTESYRASKKSLQDKINVDDPLVMGFVEYRSLQSKLNMLENHINYQK